jgi:hypothetical protein
MKNCEELNKALVLEAFDTLFNKRDYAAAERYWSPQYIQHSTHISPGREGLFKMIRRVPTQELYFDGAFMLKRWDYETDVLGGVATHYCYDSKTVDGIIIPTLRRVVRELVH